MNHSERFLRIVEEARLHVKEISPEETSEKLERGEPVLLIDTREDHEWERGHIAGATHLSKGLLERDIEGLAPAFDTPIILYCGGGYRSVLSARSLAEMGYTNVRSMATGWRGWQARGYRVEGTQEGSGASS